MTATRPATQGHCCGPVHPTSPTSPFAMPMRKLKKTPGRPKFSCAPSGGRDGQGPDLGGIRNALRAVCLAGLLAILTPAGAQSPAAASPAQLPMVPPVVTVPATAPLAAPQVLSMRHEVSSGVEVLRVDLSAPLAAIPAGFALQTPPRIAIDLPDTSSALPSPTLGFARGVLRQVSVTPVPGRTRLVLSLRQSVGWQTRLDGPVLEIRLGSASATAAQAPLAPPQAPSATAASAPSAPAAIAPAEAPTATTAPVRPAPAPHATPSAARQAPAAGDAIAADAVRGLDFRRGDQGAGRLIVSLPPTAVDVDVRTQGRQLRIDLRGASLPSALQQRYDVSDFGTPVRMVSAMQAGDLVRLLVDVEGTSEHSAWQTRETFILEVRPPQAQAEGITRLGGPASERISLNFQNIEVRALLQVIADFTQLNIIASDSVTGNLTLRLKDVPWQEALDLILQSKGLAMRRSGNVLRVAPTEELNAQDQAALEARRKLSELEPLRTQAFALNYAKAEDIARALLGSGSGGAGAAPGGGAGGGGAATRILSSRGSLIHEARTNQLFVTDIASRLEQVQALIARVDIPVRQVLIEARIVEADDSFGRALGVKLGANDLRGLQGGVPGFAVGGGNNLAIGNSYGAIGAQTRQGGTAPGFSDSAFVNLPADTSRLAGGVSATFALSLFSPSANRFLNLELSALEAEGRGKIVSSPRVITADQVKALIEQGEELPFQQATSSGATSVQFKKANLRLEVTPQITPEGQVILDVDVSKDSVGRVTPAGFAIDTRHVRTQVLVDNGGTVVIGGIFTQAERQDTNKVPWLGDAPVVGALFRNRARSVTKTELLVFLTPKVITDPGVRR
jgi:type IV pilus assembly protein PilQ